MSTALRSFAHPQSYDEQHQQATSRLSELDVQFESAVASILGITPEQQPHLLAEALQEQQQLQEVQVRRLWGAAPCAEHGTHLRRSLFCRSAAAVAFQSCVLHAW